MRSPYGYRVSDREVVAIGALPIDTIEQIAREAEVPWSDLYFAPSKHISAARKVLEACCRHAGVDVPELVAVDDVMRRVVNMQVLNPDLRPGPEDDDHVWRTYAIGLGLDDSGTKLELIARCTAALGDDD